MRVTILCNAIASRPNMHFCKENTLNMLELSRRASRPKTYTLNTPTLPIIRDAMVAQKNAYLSVCPDTLRGMERFWKSKKRCLQKKHGLEHVQILTEPFQNSLHKCLIPTCFNACIFKYMIFHQPFAMHGQGNYSTIIF